MSFSRPNLAILFREIEEVITGLNDTHIAYRNTSYEAALRLFVSFTLT